MTRVPGRPTMTRAPRGRQPLFFRRGRSRPWQCQLSRLAPAQLRRRHPRWPAKMLADYGTRWPHVRTAGFVAAQLTTLFDDDKAALLVAAATLHDIGYSKRIGRIGFHPLDGAIFLQAEGSRVPLSACRPPRPSLRGGDYRTRPRCPRSRPRCPRSRATVPSGAVLARRRPGLRRYALRPGRPHHYDGVPSSRHRSAASEP